MLNGKLASLLVAAGLCVVAATTTKQEATARNPHKDSSTQVCEKLSTTVFDSDLATGDTACKNGSCGKEVIR